MNRIWKCTPKTNNGGNHSNQENNTGDNFVSHMNGNFVTVDTTPCFDKPANSYRNNYSNDGIKKVSNP